MATSGGSSSALHAQNSSNSGGAQGGNPRKFAEKIQILNIKGAEETAEFEKIMSECAAVRVGQQNYQSDNVPSQVIDGQKSRTMNMKSSNFAPQVSGQVRASSPSNSGFPNIYAGGTGVIVTSTGTRHLSPAPFNSIVHRHGSMPNMAPLPGGNGVGNHTNKSPVGDLPAMLKQYNMTNPASIKREPQVLHQQGNLETIARISEIISVSPVPSMSTASCTTLVDGNQPSRKLPGNQTSQQYHNNRTRLNTTPSASTGSGIPGSSNSPGPIRNRQRRHETSPFERKSIAPEYAGIESNRRESGGSTGSNISAQHLSPPDLSVRRFYSDPSLHQTVNGVQQVSSQDQTNPVSDTSGSQTIVPTQVNQDPINQNISFGNTLGGVSPLENASPTIARRVVGDPIQDANQMQGVGNVTNAYVQMVNRGDSHKASSPDCRVLTTRHPPIAGQGISYLPLPGGISEGPHGSGDNLTVTQNSGAFIPGGGGKPSGSLPDLTNFHVNSQSPSPCSGPNIASGESSNGQAMPFSQSLSTAAVCSPNYSPGTPRNANVNTNGNAKLTLGKFLNNKDAQRQTVQYSTNQTSTGNANMMAHQHNTCGPGRSAEDNSSPTLTYQHPNTAKSVVRLSDNEISEILSLPIALVSENHYSGDPNLTSGSTSSNVATSAATSDSSIISPNNDGHQLPNSNGRNSTGANDVFLNKNIHSNNNNNSINIKSEPICDNSLDFLNPIQNVINLNKSVDMDQSDGGMMNEENQSMFFGASSNVDFVGGQNNPEQNYSNKGDGGLNNYRNPQPIPTAHSPSNHLQGGSSPFGTRSTSPIDISSLTGSPHHSPNPRCNPLPSIGSLESGGSIPGGGTNGYSVGTYGSASSPGYSSDMMISAGGVGGGSIGTQMDLGLSKEFQRFTVTEPGSQHQVGMYFPSSPAQTQHGQQMPQQHSLNYHNSHQPLHDWMNGGNQNHLGVDGGGNGGIDIGNNQQSNASMPSPNPQTPSSIPDILISRCGDDSGPDQTLQRLIAMGEFDNDSMFSEELRADLGKLDDNMIRLLEDNVQMDQNIADAVTEEHLKL